MGAPYTYDISHLRVNIRQCVPVQTFQSLVTNSNSNFRIILKKEAADSLRKKTGRGRPALSDGWKRDASVLSYILTFVTKTYSEVNTQIFKIIQTIKASTDGPRIDMLRLSTTFLSESRKRTANHADAVTERREILLH
jgi:hypothetical protein